MRLTLSLVVAISTIGAGVLASTFDVDEIHPRILNRAIYDAFTPEQIRAYGDDLSIHYSSMEPYSQRVGHDEIGINLRSHSRDLKMSQLGRRSPSKPKPKHPPPKQAPQTSQQSQNIGQSMNGPPPAIPPTFPAAGPPVAAAPIAEQKSTAQETKPKPKPGAENGKITPPTANTGAGTGAPSPNTANKQSDEKKKGGVKFCASDHRCQVLGKLQCTMFVCSNLPKPTQMLKAAILFPIVYPIKKAGEAVNYALGGD